MSRFRALMILPLAAFAVAAIACSSDSNEATATATSTTPAVSTTAPTAAAAEPLTIGMILVGPRDDRGWSQAHFEAGQYVADRLGAELIVIDKVNPADSPNVTLPQVVDDMLAQGARLIIATSDDMKDGILEAAAQHPDVPMIWASGDSAWQDGKSYRADLTNLGNVMGEMEYGKMIAGCAAALQTGSGAISYLGPLLNDETRRLASAAYLGARHCWTELRGQQADTLSFNVTWIGFWFAIPGVTLDPTQVVNDFFASGSDVVISGIDTTEALVRAGQVAQSGSTVWAIPYDYRDACELAPQVCLGVPFFNWGPAYLGIARSVQDGSFAASFTLIGPDWNDINDPESSAIGFLEGDGLTAENATQLDTFIAGLADGSIKLWAGPLNYQDGSEFLAATVAATEQQIWYLPQLLEGMVGASQAN